MPRHDGIILAHIGPWTWPQIGVAMFIVAVVVLVGIVDLWLCLTFGKETTVSGVLHKAAEQWGMLPYLVSVAAGMVIGHWFL